MELDWQRCRRGTALDIDLCSRSNSDALLIVAKILVEIGGDQQLIDNHLEDAFSTVFLQNDGSE